MLTKEMNERLTQVGPGTPMGELLRRYWHPLATTAELDREPVLAVKLLGENLALHRNDQGEMGLVAQRCPHRGASMAYGIPEEKGLRCPYHGWLFSPEGQCLEQPAEPEDSTFKHRVKIPAYPVQELGGLIWAYLGPDPAPLLPRWDILVRDDLVREIGVTRLPINWLQIMENSLDPTHLEFLHSMYLNYVMKRQGKPPAAKVRHHLQIAFDVWEFGVTKRRLLEGDDPETSDDWNLGHPVLFPNILAIGDHNCPRFEIRVPMDDVTTLHYFYFTRPRKEGEAPQRPEDVPVYENPYKDENGRLIVDNVTAQDMMVWVTQGDITDRTTERLGTGDKGVILYRNLLNEQIQKVQRGEDPMAILRDPARNYPMLEVPRERHAFFVPTGGMLEEQTEDPLAMFRTKKNVVGA